MNLAHTVATTLVPRKGSFIKISNRDIFVIYCLLNKININWVLQVREYMVECFEDTNSAGSLPYGLLIARIIVDSLVDLSNYRPTFIDATYDTRTFSIMDYVFINEKWHQKESVKSRADTPQTTRISADFSSLLLKEAEHIRISLDNLQSYMQVLEYTLGKVLQLHKYPILILKSFDLRWEDLRRIHQNWI